MLEASPVALEHLDPCVQVVADRHRLRSLQVGVAGQRRLGLALGEVEDRLRQPRDARNRLSTRVLDVEPRGRCHLVVARAARVDLAADRAEQSLDCRVHVLVVVEVGGAIVRDRRQPGLDLGELALVEDARRVKSSRVFDSNSRATTGCNSISRRHFSPTVTPKRVI